MRATDKPGAGEEEREDPPGQPVVQVVDQPGLAGGRQRFLLERW